jgi:mRNA-degrading endonuclease toxin of MazEF toxin-antitoxin module
MKIKREHIYAANLNPRFGTEPGKMRPVLVLQKDPLLIHFPLLKAEANY